MVRIFKKKQELTGRNVASKTGERSSNFSYYSRSSVKPETKRSKPKQEVVIDQDRVGILVRLPRLIIFFVIVFGLLYLIWLNGTTSVQVLNGKKISFLQNPLVYKKASQAYLAKSISSHTKISVNILGLDSYLEHTFPEINNSSTSIPLIGSNLRTTINSAQPIAIMEDSASHRFYLKAGGYVMAQDNLSKPDIKNNLVFPYIIEKFQKLSLGQHAMSLQDLQFIQYIEQELNVQSVPAISYTLLANSRELDVKTQANNILLKFNLQNNVKEQVGSYLSLRKYLLANHITPSSYIDLRVEGRAYYK